MAGHYWTGEKWMVVKDTMLEDLVSKVAHVEVIKQTMRDQLEKLRLLVELAIDEAHKEKNVSFKSDAINWGDLHCVQSEWFFTERGETGYRVFIEEAAPEATEFCQFISNHLFKLGFPDVEVLTEW